MDKTFLAIKDVAEKLGVSDKTIYRMLSDNQLPFAVKIGGQWRFRADAMDAWIMGQSGAEPETRKINSAVSLAESLERGAVLYRIHGSNRDEAIEELLAAVPYSASFDWTAVKVSVFARESLASSSIGGIAYMGLSADRPVFMEKTMVFLAFLEKPTDFRALDKVKTEAFFLVLPANLAEQAMVEMKLRHLAMDSEFIELIKSEPSRKELLSRIAAQEEFLFGPARATTGTG